MDIEKFWQLLSVKLSGEATDEELEEFDDLVKRYPELGWQTQLMSQLWKKREERDEIATDSFFNRHLQRFSNQPDADDISRQMPESGFLYADEGTYRKKEYGWIYVLSGIAASIALVFLFYYYADSSGEDKQVKKIVARNVVATRKGSKSNIQLPDGSTVWLNADSKITYDENFGDSFREVALTGEAYFDVVKDERHPFIIHTTTIDIKVLGTAFNVKAYEAESNTETTLIRGSVEVTLRNSPEKKIILKPNEKLRVNNTGLEYVTGTEPTSHKPVVDDLNMVVGKVHYQKKDSSALETLWVKNKLAFDAETLEEAMRKIERWYNVSVQIMVDESMRSTQYSAIFDNENLSEVMEALRITGNFSYSINKDIVTIR